MDYLEEDTGKAVEELTLVLLYLTRFRDHGFPEGTYESWKGYDFKTLDSLSEKGDIWGSRRSKSVCIGEQGCDRARKLLNKYGIKDWEKDF